MEFISSLIETYFSRKNNLAFYQNLWKSLKFFLEEFCHRVWPPWERADTVKTVKIIYVKPAVNIKFWITFVCLLVGFFQQVISFHSIASNFIFRSKRQCLYLRKNFDQFNCENSYPRNTILCVYQPIHVKFSTLEDWTFQSILRADHCLRLSSCIIQFSLKK